MKTFKGTPGPWFEHREGFSTVYIEARIGGGIIQEVAACGPCDKGSEQQSANAKLIAAAPELLEALQELISGYEDREQSGMFDMLVTGDLIEKANAAINKALGE